MSHTMIYFRTETRTRLQALAHMDDRPMVDYLERLLRSEVSKIDPTRYNHAVEKVTAGPKDE